jgi:hypothetical protein
VYACTCARHLCIWKCVHCICDIIYLSTRVCLYVCTICMHTNWAHVCAYVGAHVYLFIHAQYICIWVCVHCMFHIIYLSTCVCLVNVHFRNVCCAWNGKCKVDNVLANVRFSAALILVRICVVHMCNLLEHMCMPFECAYSKCMMCIGRTRVKRCLAPGLVSGGV